MQIWYRDYDRGLKMMGISVTATTDFISRLVWANHSDALHPIEVKRLLDKSVATIEELRTQSGIFPIPGRDAIICIKTVASGADRVGHEEWHHSLLHAAEMIRDLRVVMDTGTEITISRTPPIF